MKTLQLKESDFIHDCNANGYMLYYKGHPIGGASVQLQNTSLHPAHARDFIIAAKLDIARIAAGKGPKYQMDEIEKIAEAASEAELNIQAEEDRQMSALEKMA